MRLRSTILAVFRARALVGACGADPPAAITAPPVAADAQVWPAVDWAPTVVEDRPAGMRDERVVALAASDVTIVAVGVASGDGRDVGQAWWSGLDGVMTRATGPFDGVTLDDVAAGPGGFVAVGTRSGDPWLGGVTRLALFHSDDGRTWEVMLDGARAPAGFATGIAGGPAGYVALGYTDPEPGGIVLTSPDGTTWTEGEPIVDGRPGGVVDPSAVEGGWLAAMGGTGAAIARSTDGISWTSAAIEPLDTNALYVDRVIQGVDGYLAGGAAGSGCGPGASCAAESVTWWSADGETWGRQSGIDPMVAAVALGDPPGTWLRLGQRVVGRVEPGRVAVGGLERGA